MRTSIEIDDSLMAEALKATGETTTRAVVERGLRMLVHVKRQGAIRRLRGREKWIGTLAEGRRGRISSAAKP